MDPLFSLTIAWSLAALFAASTLHKMMALSEWPGVVRNYRLLPDGLGGAAAWFILAAGALTTSCLLFGPTRRIGAIAAAIQLLLFGTAIKINIGRGRTLIDCGCFGSKLSSGLSRWMVVRNAVLALAALSLLLPALPRAITALETVVCAGAVVTLAFLYPVMAVVLNDHASRKAAGAH
jgi:hypothetical protein